MAGRRRKVQNSWWPDYVAWLAERSGDDVDAPTTLGAEGFIATGPAPGTYVLQK